MGYHIKHQMQSKQILLSYGLNVHVLAMNAAHKLSYISTRDGCGYYALGICFVLRLKQNFLNFLQTKYLALTETKTSRMAKFVNILT